MLIGLARDLRGIAFALNTKTSYTMLFDWMYPYYTMTIPALCTEGYQASCISLIVWHSGEEETKLNELMCNQLKLQHNGNHAVNREGSIWRETTERSLFRCITLITQKIYLNGSPSHPKPVMFP